MTSSPVGHSHSWRNISMPAISSKAFLGSQRTHESNDALSCSTACPRPHCNSRPIGLRQRPPLACIFLRPKITGAFCTMLETALLKAHWIVKDDDTAAAAAQIAAWCTRPMCVTIKLPCFGHWSVLHKNRTLQLKRAKNVKRRPAIVNRCCWITFSTLRRSTDSWRTWLCHTCYCRGRAACSRRCPKMNSSCKY